MNSYHLIRSICLVSLRVVIDEYIIVVKKCYYLGPPELLERTLICRILIVFKRLCHADIMTILSESVCGDDDDIITIID